MLMFQILPLLLYQMLAMSTQQLQIISPQNPRIIKMMRTTTIIHSSRMKQKLQRYSVPEVQQTMKRVTQMGKYILLQLLNLLKNMQPQKSYK
uniref:Uncharacterized protein n=1 Tax=Picea sitchensis TaxID=3332 RepID=A9NM80_PICSI|nr:unknown [Picea sitchensis]